MVGCTASQSAAPHYNEFNDYAKMLNDLKFTYKADNTKPRTTFITEDEDLELYPKFTDVKLAFKTNINTIITPKNIIAVAPLGMYVAEAKGWTGFKIFFETDEKTTCAYAFINLKLSNGGVFLSDSDQNFFINKKHGFQTSSGNKKSGFIYTINWYDSQHVHMLDCANVAFDKKGNDKTKQLAVLIDKTTI